MAPLPAKSQSSPRNGAAASESAVTGGPHYIKARSPTRDEQARILKHGDLFAVFDRYGDIRPGGLGEEGLYHRGTRFLSCLNLSIESCAPLFLSSTIKQENDILAIDLTNPDLPAEGEVKVQRGSLHISRVKFLWQGAGY